MHWYLLDRGMSDANICNRSTRVLLDLLQGFYKVEIATQTPAFTREVEMIWEMSLLGTGF
jgi:hypothetical protein